MPLDHRSIIYETPTIRVEHFSREVKARRVAFCFSSFDNQVLDGAGFGGEFFLSQGIDVIAIKNVGKDWYQKLTEDFFIKISELCRINNYTYRFGYGSSMGGFASIVFLRRLSFDVVFSLSPQYRINLSFDRRWSNYVDGATWNYEIDFSSVSANTFFYIAYDPYDIDAKHVDLIKKYILDKNIFLIKVPYVGHPVTDFFSEAGALKYIAESVFIHRDFGMVNLPLLKKNSAVYWANLAEKFHLAGKLERAYRCIVHAISIRPQSSKYLQIQGMLLARMNKIDEAVAVLRRACDAQSGQSDAMPFFVLGLTLQKKNQVLEALRYIDEAIKINSNEDIFHLARARLLRQLGTS